MNDPQPMTPRRRLQELLAVPERQRTDAQWDEINELEITLASTNRIEKREPDARRHASAPATQPRPGGVPGGVRQGKKPIKKFHKRPAKPTPP